MQGAALGQLGLLSGYVPRLALLARQIVARDGVLWIQLEHPFQLASRLGSSTRFKQPRPQRDPHLGEFRSQVDHPLVFNQRSV